ncbi:condensation domain-containing protein [Nocardiopsis sp. NPDC049922]|uniref:condensation domain-containing protein n=1 Tax=Nocardiopsis sp. NPDC049922 TaxID=3155157 RepID=UPI0033C9CE21
MNLDELLLYLREEDVRLSRRDGRLAFDAPDGAITDTVLAALRDHKDTLLDGLVAGPPPPEASGPATWMQRHLANLHDRTDNPATWNVSYCLDLSGSLDTSALDRAVSLLVERHDLLRTCFRGYAGSLVQEVRPAAPIRLDTVDLRPSDEERASEERVGEWCQEAAEEAFQVEGGPLIRMPLARVGAQEWVLMLVQHHMITDAVAVGILFRELAALYTDAVHGREPTLPPIRTRLIDYARWQRGQLEGERGERLMEYWREQFADADLTLALPGDRPRPDHLSGAGTVVSTTIPPHLAERLEEYARSRRVTLYTVLLTAFGRLLTDLSAQKEVVVVGNSANRDRTEFESLVGMLVTSLPLRLRFDSADTVEDAVRSVGRTVLGALDHQTMPFPLVRDRLRFQDLPGGDRFPYVWFGFNQPAPRDLGMPGLRASVEEVLISGARADFGVVVVPEQGLQLCWELSTDFLTAETAERWARRYRNLLERLLEEPTLEVAEWR